MTKTRNLADLGGGFIQAGTGAQQRTVESKLQDVVSVLDFIPESQHAAIKAGTSTYDATADIQAAIDAAQGTLLIADNLRITSTLTLRSNLNVKIISGGVITWDGVAGGTVITNPTDSVMVSTSFECDGGFIDMVDAGIGMRLYSAQYCKFDLEFTGDSTTSTAVWIESGATSLTGSLTGTTNIVSNVFNRILHQNQCGTLLKIIGVNDAFGGIITLNTFRFMRAGFAAVGGVLISGWADTNVFPDAINIRLNGDNSVGIKFDDQATVYENKFFQVSIGAYSSYVGRIGAYIGALTRENNIDKLFIDGDLDAEGGNLVVDPTTKGYRVQIAKLGTDILDTRVRFRDQRGFSFNSENEPILLATDTATSYRLRADQGIVAICSDNGDVTSLVWVRATGGLASRILFGSSFLEVTTGPLTGTTGNPVRFTVSVDSVDRMIYFENRTGANVKFSYAVLGGFTL